MMWRFACFTDYLTHLYCQTCPKCNSHSQYKIFTKKKKFRLHPQKPPIIYLKLTNANHFSKVRNGGLELFLILVSFEISTFPTIKFMSPLIFIFIRLYKKSKLQYMSLSTRQVFNYRQMKTREMSRKMDEIREYI